MNNSIPTVSFTQAMECVKAGIKADIATLLIGSPGVGKSALVQQVAKELNMPLYTVIGSTLDPTDLGGLPVVNKQGTVDRIPLTIIRKCCEEPSILFLDELACAPPSVQSAMLRLILERVAGDYKLHPGTRVVAATNPPEQSPGGTELSPPLIGRVAIYNLYPTLDEVCDYFMNLIDIGNLGTMFVGILQTQPDMLQIDIPQTAISNPIPWGSPRAWERGFKTLSTIESPSKTTIRTILAGSVGNELAAGFANMIDMYKHLPKISDVVDYPDTTPIPEEKYQVALGGFLLQVAKKDLYAAFIYADRITNPENRAAWGRKLCEYKNPPSTSIDQISKWKAQGSVARTRILKDIPRSRQ